MRTFQIALYPGDGIGVEVIDSAVRILEALRRRLGGFELSMTRFLWGAGYAASHGSVGGGEGDTSVRLWNLVSNER